MYQTQQTYKYREQTPQSNLSETIPNQAPSLENIIGALKRGEEINVRMNMQYDNDPDLDNLDMRYYDKRNMTAEQIEALIPADAPPADALPADAPPSEIA